MENTLPNPTIYPNPDIGWQTIPPDPITSRKAYSPPTSFHFFCYVNCLLKHIDTVERRIISWHPSMIIVRQVFFLCDPDRNKDRLSHCISLKSDIDGKHLRYSLNYCFVDRIRDAISNRVIQDQRVIFPTSSPPALFVCRPARKQRRQRAKTTMICQAFMAVQLSVSKMIYILPWHRNKDITWSIRTVPQCHYHSGLGTYPDGREVLQSHILSSTC